MSPIKKSKAAIIVFQGMKSKDSLLKEALSKSKQHKTKRNK